MDDIQGAGQGTPSTGGEQQTVSTVAPVSAEVSGSQENLSQSGGQTGEQQQSEFERQLRGLQSVVDKQGFTTEQIRQQMSFIAQKLNEIATSRPNAQVEEQNPYDPQAQPNQWLDWRDQKLLERNRKVAREEFRQEFQSLLQQAQETQWAQTHNGVNPEQVKQFAQMQFGVREVTPQLMELAYREMIQSNQVAPNNSQNRQSQSGAQPVRQGSNGSGQPQYRYADLLKAYNQNPDIENTWSPELRQNFWAETNLRKANFNS